MFLSREVQHVDQTVVCIVFLFSVSHNLCLFLTPTFSVPHEGGAVGVCQHDAGQVSHRCLHPQQQTGEHLTGPGLPKLRQVGVTKMEVYSFTKRAQDKISTLIAPSSLPLLSDQCTIGLVVPIWSDTQVYLDGDG